MSFTSIVDNTVLRANQAVNKINAVKASPGFVRGAALARELGGGMKRGIMRGGFGVKAGLMGAAGGGAGYLYGDGDLGTTLKGAGLGVLGAAGHEAFRVGRASYRGGKLGKEIAAGRAAVRRGYARELGNSMLRSSGGTSAWGLPGQMGPASHWMPGASGTFIPI